MKYEHTIDIDASPTVVWATLSDVPAWPTWTASVTQRRMGRREWTHGRPCGAYPSTETASGNVDCHRGRRRPIVHLGDEVAGLLHLGQSRHFASR